MRLQGCKTLKQLEPWPPSVQEKELHQARNAAGPARPNWPKRLRAIQHSPFLLPKYRQLIYWITTDSVLDGNRLIRTSIKGRCSYCGVIASTPHIFKECHITVKVWALANQLGASHWPDYCNFKYEMIPDMLSEYDPKYIFQICFLWAIWTNTCDRFYCELSPEQLNFDYIVQDILKRAHAEFTKRVCESKAVTQWIKLQEARHSNKQEGVSRVPEKLFLLRHAHMVRTNPDSIILEDETNLDDNMRKWIANEYLLVVEDNSYHRPRLRINHAVWANLYPMPPVGPPADPASGWTASQPRCVT